MITVTLKVTKAKVKSNITGSISANEDGSFRSVNITGKMTHLEGFIDKNGNDHSDKLPRIDCGSTVIINNQSLGDHVIETAANIFAERAAVGDLNPAIDLIIKCKTVRVRKTNILIVNVKDIQLDADTQVIDNTESIEDAIAELELNSLNNKKVLHQNNAASAAASIAERLSGFVKTHF